MIEEAYVSFETAKLLKKKGFNEPCICYSYGEGMNNYFSKSRIIDNLNKDASYILLPTQQMAMRWLREVHHINIDIVSIWNQIRWEYQIFIITPTTAKCPYVDDTLYIGHEEAVETAIQYSLENLI